MVWPWSGDVLVSSLTVPPVSGSRTRLLCRCYFCDRLKPCPYRRLSHIVAHFGDGFRQLKSAAGRRKRKLVAESVDSTM